jgi:hypothetical protein
MAEPFPQGTVVQSVRVIRLPLGVRVPVGTQGVVSGDGVQLVPYFPILDPTMNKLTVHDASLFSDWDDWEEAP